jgi:hypothetical protein
MRMRKTVSAMIFSSLFIGAWYVQEQEDKKNQWTNKNLLQPAGLKDEMVDAESTSTLEVEPVADLEEEVIPEPFKPREYIRLAK